MFTNRLPGGRLCRLGRGGRATRIELEENVCGEGSRRMFEENARRECLKSAELTEVQKVLMRGFRVLPNRRCVCLSNDV